MESVRPTLRTLTDDLRLPLPPIDELLEEIDHPLLTKARTKFSAPNAAHERIRAIDDEVVWKVKGPALAGSRLDSGPKRLADRRRQP